MSETNKQTKTEAKLQEMQDFIELCWEPVPSVVSVINPTKLKKHVDELKSAAQEDLQQLYKMMENEQTIISQAQLKAEQIIDRAKSEVEMQDIVIQSKEYAKHIIQEAQKRAEDLLNEAQNIREELIVNSLNYADNLMLKMEEKLRENREELKYSLEDRIKEQEKLG